MGNCFGDERLHVLGPQPEFRDVIPGSSVRIAVTITGPRDPREITWEFKASGEEQGWKRIEDSLRIQGAQSNAITIPQVTREDQGYYRAFAETPNGSTLMTRESHLTLACVPEISCQPRNQCDVIPRHNVALSIQATGKQPRTYQWQRKLPPSANQDTEWHILDANDERYEGVNTANLVIRDVRHSDEGQYRCIVRNALGNCESEVASLTVAHAPRITSHPQQLTAPLGHQASLSVEATGTESREYSWEWKPQTAEGVQNHQWQPLPKDSSRIRGVDTATVTIDDISKSDEGSYRCVVTNKVGREESEDAVLTIADPPSIVKQPEGQTDLIPDKDVSLVVEATGTEPLDYHWEKKVEGCIYTLKLQAGRNSLTFHGSWQKIDTLASSPGGRQNLKISGFHPDVLACMQSTCFPITPSLEGLDGYLCTPGARQSMPAALQASTPSHNGQQRLRKQGSLHAAERHSIPCADVLQNPIHCSQSCLPFANTIVSQNSPPAADSCDPLEGDNWQALHNDPARFDGVESPRLTIHKIRESDEGVYRCCIRNIAGEVVTNSTSITVTHVDALMQRACKEKNTEELRKLLTQWKSKNSVEILQKALMAVVSMKEEYTDVVKVVMETGISLTFQSEGWTPVQKACARGHSRVLEYFLTKGVHLDIKTEDGRGLLHLACEKGHLKVAMVLISKRVDVNLQDKKRMTPLHVTCEAAKELSPGKVRQLAEILVLNGARCDLQDEAVRNPLHIICSAGDAVAGTVLLLLSKGALVNSKDRASNTPLHIVSTLGYSEIAEKLLNAKADPTIENQDGSISLHLACAGGHTDTVKVLLDPKIMKTALEPKKGQHYTNACNHARNTPLHLACSDGFRKIVEMLHRSGADVNLENEDSDTPLHLACSGGFSKTVKFLLQKGANVDHKNNDGNTALHLACSSGFQEIVEMLMADKSASRILENKDGHIAADLAILNWHVNLLSIKGLNPRIQRSSSGMPTDGDGTGALQPRSSDSTQEEIDSLNHTSPASPVVYRGPTKEVLAQAAKGALQKHFRSLTSSVVPPAVAPDLYSEGIIDGDAIEMARNQLYTMQNRAEGLLLDLIRKVEARPQWFETICAIFEKQLVPCVQAIREEYQKQVLCLEMERASTEGDCEALTHIMGQCDASSEVAKKGLKVATKKGQVRIVAMLLEDHQVPPDIKDDDDATLLHLAAEEGHSNIVELLLNTEKIGVEVKDKKQRTPLHCVCGALGRVAPTVPEGSETGTSKARLLGLVSLLLKKGARMDTKDETGNTPLHLVCMRGSVDAVKLLLTEGDTEQCNQTLLMQNKSGETPVEAARQFDSIVKILNKRKAGKQQLTKHLKFWQKQEST